MLLDHWLKPRVLLRFVWILENLFPWLYLGTLPPIELKKLMFLLDNNFSLLGLHMCPISVKFGTHLFQVVSDDLRQVLLPRGIKHEQVEYYEVLLYPACEWKDKVITELLG